MNARIGDWIQLRSGRRFYPLDPRPNEISIFDIAHSLSMKCRYGGHCSRFYSVAEHSVLVSENVPAEHALWGLLHDAGEAYLADVPKPVKPSLPGWKQLEAEVMAAVCARFKLPEEEPPEVKQVDFAILADEKEALMPGGEDWSGLPPKLGVQIRGLMPAEAKEQFLARFVDLIMIRHRFAEAFDAPK